MSYDEFWQELDDPPSPDQLEFWKQIRLMGRARYIGRGIFLITLFGLGIWLTSRFLIAWLFDEQLNFSGGIELLPAFPGVAWLIFRERWSKNETRYRNAIQDLPTDTYADPN